MAVDSVPSISPQGYQGGYALTYDGGTWSAPLRVDQGSLDAVSCASPTFCVATDIGGSVYVYTSGHWSSGSPLPGETTVQLTSVSCTASSFCMAVGIDQSAPGLGWASTYASGEWSAGASFPLASRTAFALQVSCASTSFCMAVDTEGNAYRYTGNWTAAPGRTSATETPSVSCPTVSVCVAAGVDDVDTYAGGRWEGDVPLRGVDLAAVSCGSPESCVAVGASAGDQPDAFVFGAP